MLLLRQLLHFVAFFLEAVGTSLFTQFEEGNLLGRIVHNHQGTLFGKALHFKVERRAVDGLVQQQAVVEEDGNGIAFESLDQREGIVFGIVASAFVFTLEAHAHVDEEDDHEDDGEGQDAVAYHELLVGVQTVCHSGVLSLIVAANVPIISELSARNDHILGLRGFLLASDD